MNDTCEHVFKYEGVRYKIGEKRPGSGAQDVEYFDSYYCERCLERQTKSLGIHSHTYESIKFGARPM